MLNKKGFTMVELMVSIALISIVMIFLVKLLVDVRYEGTNEVYDIKDQISRAEIIKTIENDLKDYNIIDVTSTGNTLKTITIQTEENGNSKIELSNDNPTTHTTYLTYTTLDGKKYKWTLKLASDNSDVQYDLDSIKCKVIKNDKDTQDKDYVLVIEIPVVLGKSKRYTTTDKNNGINNDSTLDNIVLTFYGYSNQLRMTEEKKL